MSLSVLAPTVVTTDQVRPDWDQKLMNARTHQARRSAAATALHTAAYMMGGRGYDEGRFHFGRRGLLRRISAAESPNSSSNPHFNFVSILSDNHRNSSGLRVIGDRDPTSNTRGDEPSSNRVEDLEELMMMEAIRLSLASEEEHRRKEEKDARKDAKKKDKEAKKAGKAAKKAGAIHRPALPDGPQPGKGKQPLQVDNGVDEGDAESADDHSYRRTLEEASDAQTYLERARNQIQPMEYPSGRPAFFSHLRKPSYASSTDDASSLGSLGLQGSKSSLQLSANASLDDLADTGVRQRKSSGSTPAPGGSNIEAMINFSSLTAMVDRGGTSETTKQEVGSSTEAHRSAQEQKEEQDAGSDEEHGERYYDTHTSSDFKVQTPNYVNDRVMHQHSQAS